MSDEEYNDLAMQDIQENGYQSDDDEESKSKPATNPEQPGQIMQGSKYHQNLDHFLRTRNELVPEHLCSYSSLLLEESERNLLPPGKAKLRKRSLSIPSLGKYGSAINDLILSGSAQR